MGNTCSGNNSLIYILSILGSDEQTVEPNDNQEVEHYTGASKDLVTTKSDTPSIRSVQTVYDKIHHKLKSRESAKRALSQLCRESMELRMRSLPRTSPQSEYSIEIQPDQISNTLADQFIDLVQTAIKIQEKGQAISDDRDGKLRQQVEQLVEQVPVRVSNSAEQQQESNTQSTKSSRSQHQPGEFVHVRARRSTKLDRDKMFVDSQMVTQKQGDNDIVPPQQVSETDHAISEEASIISEQVSTTNLVQSQQSVEYRADSERSNGHSERQGCKRDIDLQVSDSFSKKSTDLGHVKEQTARSKASEMQETPLEIQNESRQGSPTFGQAQILQYGTNTIMNKSAGMIEQLDETFVQPVVEVQPSKRTLFSAPENIALSIEGEVSGEYIARNQSEPQKSMQNTFENNKEPLSDPAQERQTFSTKPEILQPDTNAIVDKGNQRQFAQEMKEFLEETIVQPVAGAQPSKQTAITQSCCFEPENIAFSIEGEVPGEYIVSNQSKPQKSLWNKENIEPSGAPGIRQYNTNVGMRKKNERYFGQDKTSVFLNGTFSPVEAEPSNQTTETQTFCAEQKIIAHNMEGKALNQSSEKNHSLSEEKILWGANNEQTIEGQKVESLDRSEETGSQASSGPYQCSEPCVESDIPKPNRWNME